MTLEELLPAAHSLPQLDKVRLIQFLAGELLPSAVGSSETSLIPGDYPLWSPHESSEAASVLLDALAADARA